MNTHLSKSIIFIAFTFIMVSCQKYEIKKELANGDKYELRSTLGGQVGHNFKVGNGNYLFLDDKTYELYAQDTLIRKGTYSLENKKYIDCTNTKTKSIVFKSDDSFNNKKILFNNPENNSGLYNDYKIEIEDNKLYFKHGCFQNDLGFLYIYEKVN